MKKLLLALPFLLVLALPLISVAAEGISWIPSFNAGLRQARQLEAPVAIEFRANWCQPCMRMDREVFTDSKLIEVSKPFGMIGLDIERDPQTAQRLEDPRHWPNLRQMEKAAAAVGKQLVISFE